MASKNMFESATMEGQKIIPCLWFDQQAKEATDFYTTLFKNSKTGKTTYYGKEGYKVHGMPEGTVLTVDFELDGCRFTALNGGPYFQFNPSITFFVTCESAEKLDSLLNDPDKERSERVMKAMLQMKKLDVNALQKAYHE